MTPSTIKRHIADAIADAVHTLECLESLTPNAAHTRTARDLHMTVNAIASCAVARIKPIQALLTEAETPAPGDDEIVEAMWDAYSAVRDKDLHASCRPAMAAALAVARSMIEGQTAQAAPALTVRSAEEVRAEIERINQLYPDGLENLSSFDKGRLSALRRVLNEQETGR